MQNIAETEDGSHLLIGNWYTGMYERDGTGEWILLSNHLGSSLRRQFSGSSYLDPDGSILYAFVKLNYGSNWISRDGGQTWNTFPSLQHQSTTDQFISSMYESGKWMVMGRTYFSVSHDEGATWSQGMCDSLSNQKMGFFEDPLDSAKLYYYGFYQAIEGWGEYGGLVCSPDTGHTWDNLHPVISFYRDFGSNNGVIRAGIRMSNGDYLVVFNNIDATQRENWRTNVLVRVDSNGTAVGRFGSELPSNQYPHCLIEVRGHPGRLLTSGAVQISLYRSDDYGETWHLELGNGLPDFRITIDQIWQNPWTGRVYVASAGCGLYSSDDGGTTWSHVQTPFGDPWPMMHFQPDGATVTLTQSQYIYTSGEDGTDFSITATNPTTADSAGSLQTAFLADDTLFISGLHWATHYPGDDPGYVVKIFGFEPNGSPPQEILSEEGMFGILPITTQSGTRLERLMNDGLTLQTSWDHGRSWASSDAPAALIPTVYPATDDTSSVYYSPTDGLLCYSYRTHTWTNLELPQSANSHFDASLCRIGKFLFYGDARTRDLYVFNGEQWQERAHPESDVPVVSAWQGPSGTLLFAPGGDDVKLYVSSDTARSWRQVEMELPFPNQINWLKTVTIDPYRQHLWITTGAGMFWTDLSEFDAVNDRATFHPAGYTLMSAYPNPSNGVVTFSLELARRGEVRVDVVNLLGQRVYRWEGGPQGAGQLTTTWTPDHLASGSYIASLFLDGKRVTQKRITLVK